MREKDAGVEEKLGSAQNLMKSCQMALATLVPPESIDAAGSLFLPYPSELWLGRGDTVRKCQIFSLTFVLIASRYHDGDHCSEKTVGFHSLFFHSHGFPPTSSFGNCEAFSNHLLQMRFKQQLCRSSSCKLQNKFEHVSQFSMFPTCVYSWFVWRRTHTVFKPARVPN